MIDPCIHVDVLVQKSKVLCWKTKGTGRKTAMQGKMGERKGAEGVEGGGWGQDEGDIAPWQDLLFSRCGPCRWEKEFVKR